MVHDDVPLPFDPTQLLPDSTSGVISSRSDPADVWELYTTFSGDVAFDVGSNGGHVAATLAPRFGRVVAFEPAEESFRYLSERDLPINVAVDPRAVSEVSGTIDLEVRDQAIGRGELVTGTSLAMAWGESAGTRSIEACTLTEAADEYGVPDFVKIDVEGHEVAVIRGGLDLIVEHRPRLLIEVHSQDNGDEIRQLLDHLYAWVRHDAPSYAPGSFLWHNHYWLVG